MAKPKAAKVNIVFVCTGNTCRSPMAEYVMKAYLRKKKVLGKFSVSSCGIFASGGDKMTDGAIAALNTLGINGSEKHRSRRITAELIKKADIIVCMTEAHRASIEQLPLYPHVANDGKRRILGTAKELIGSDILDPYGGSNAVYLESVNIIASLCQPLLAAAIEFTGVKI